MNERTVVSGPQNINLTGSLLDATGVESGIYQLSYTLDNPIVGCPESAEVNLEVVSAVSAGVGTSRMVCEGDAAVIDLFTLLTNADIGGEWEETSQTNSTGGAFSSASGMFNLSGQEIGTYTFLYSLAANGPCGESESVVTVVINQLPKAETGPELTLDCGETAIIGGDGTSSGPAFSYQWYDSNGQALSGANNETLEIENPGSYTLEVTDNSTGCANSSTQIVTAENNVIETDYQTSICEGSELMIGDELISSNTPQGQVVVENGSSTGCDSVINYQLNLWPTYASVLDTTLCFGETLVVNGEVYDELNNSAILNLESVNGCDSIVELYLEYIEAPEAVNDFALGDSGSVRVYVLDNDNYSSADAIELSISSMENVLDVNLLNDNSLLVDLLDDFNGIASISYELCDTECGELCSTAILFVDAQTSEVDYDKEVLSPNEDGVNDVLVLPGFTEDEEIEGSKMQIFNRWGQLVFSIENYKNDWRGDYQGDTSKPLPEGIYYYFMYKGIGITASGSRSIIR